ncbi:MAG: hypothetical protein EOP72_04675 [Variovorax sp.]|nr:MAG: hypothetical protein EOP72_04675 [Variovorax sp.]
MEKPVPAGTATCGVNEGAGVEGGLPPIVDAAAAAMPDHPVMAASSDAARITRARTRVDSHPGAAAPVRSSARSMRPPCLVVIAAPRT